ncbi:uncharacterized protein LOC119459661 [Dermacentor silvarum]|uniref:uncharacterized protein LOC119459661 n=1 Tax=Dermacentor silvarum TaxID=543639 RepID=UPI001899255C|nr:uncharacterized protein LOC119459661 [Dermacentor silvarum]
MKKFLGYFELRTGNILIGMVSVIQSIFIILAGSASYAESSAFSDFHLTWICMASLLLIASLMFVKGVGDKIPGLMVPWILAMVPFTVWLVGAAVWAAVNSKMMEPVNATLMFAFAIVEAYFLSCAIFYHRVLIREH